MRTTEETATDRHEVEHAPLAVLASTDADDERDGVARPGAVAVAWTLRNPAVDGAIVGFRRPDQVDAILVAASLELTDEDVDEIERRYRS